MRSPDCVIIFHSNRSVEVEPLLLIILKTDFLSRNDQSILNIYSLILSKKKQTLACPNIRSARIETKKNGAVSIVAENPKYPGITKEIPPISLLYRFVRRNVFQSQVGWKPRIRGGFLLDQMRNWKIRDA